MRRRISFHAFVAVGIAALIGCQRATPDTDPSAKDLAAIRATSERWSAAMHEGRWTDAAATYTADAMLRFPDSTYQGRDAILKYFESHKPLPATFELHIDEVRGRGDMAFVMGHSTVSPVGGAPFVTGRYLDIRLRQPDGSWLYYRDMVSPAPKPSATAP